MPSCTNFPPIKPFSCSECLYCTKYKDTLIQHQLTHSGIKPFSCKMCSYKTIRKSDLIKHQLTHSDLKPLFCKECSFRTNYKRSLIKHQLTHSGIKHLSCKECSFRTNYKRSLIKHQLSHSRANPFINSSECALYTGLKGSYSENHHVTHSRSTNSDLLKGLSDHLNYHYIDDRKLYSCKDCLYRTVQEKYMKVHQLAHSSKDAFSCPKCNFKTLRKSSLDIHEQYHLRYTAKE